MKLKTQTSDLIDTFIFQYLISNRRDLIGYLLIKIPCVYCLNNMNSVMRSKLTHDFDIV